VYDTCICAHSARAVVTAKVTLLGAGEHNAISTRCGLAPREAAVIHIRVPVVAEFSTLDVTVPALGETIDVASKILLAGPVALVTLDYHAPRAPRQVVVKGTDLFQRWLR